LEKKVFSPVDKTHTTGTPIGKYTRQTHGVTHLLHTAEVEMDIWVYERTQTAHRDTQAIVPPIDIEKSVTVTGAAANVFEYFISDI
jgi:hypothetical protein